MFRFTHCCRGSLSEHAPRYSVATDAVVPSGDAGVSVPPAPPEIPTPTPAVNLRFNIDGLTKGLEGVGGLFVGEVEEKPE